MPVGDTDKFIRQLSRRIRLFDAVLRIFKLIGIFILVVGFLGMVLAPGFCVDRQRALRAARDSGYTDPRITSEHRIMPYFFGCSEKDSAGFEMSAVNVQQQRVNFIVCCGWLFKGCTVRMK